jgi:hypothetical protein
MSMSKIYKKSVSHISQVSQNQDKVSQPEEIFLQPIDQQYERVNKSFDMKDLTCFFAEYEQKSHMKDMMNLLDLEELQTDCDSPVGLSVKGEDDVLPRRKSVKLKNLLKDNWETTLETTIRSQKSILKFLAEQKFRNCVLSPFTVRTRAYSNSVQSSKLNFNETCPFFRATETTKESAFNADEMSSVKNNSVSNVNRGSIFFKNSNC